MIEREKMAVAQISRDDFVPGSPPGKMGWCPQCGAWSLPGECQACRRREEVLRVIRPHMGESLETWLEGIGDRTGFLLEGYRARRQRYLREGNQLGLLAMEQAEREFAESLPKGA